MPQFQEKAKLVKSEELAPQIYRHTYHSPQVAKRARPGQFVMIQTSKERDPLLRRPFSLHQCEENGLIQVLFKVVGRGTKLLADCDPGSELSLLGPLGNGFKVSSTKKTCLVGGGMGIAPILFLAADLKRRNFKARNVEIVLGARTVDELLPLLDDFSKLGFPLHTATDDGSLGHHGLVTDLMNEISLNSDYEVHCCGPRPMMMAVHLYSGELKMNCFVSVETGMACGIGACLGCTVTLKDGSYAHACSDGPVFNAGDLLWNL